MLPVLDMGTPFLFRCPNTGQTVQGWTAKEPAPDEYIEITCDACARVHLVNPATEKVMGQDKRPP
jgi:hypothetical protein